MESARATATASGVDIAGFDGAGCNATALFVVDPQQLALAPFTKISPVHIVPSAHRPQTMILDQLALIV